MVSRREVLAGGGGLAALGLGLSGVPAWSADARLPDQRPSLFLYDRLVPDLDGVLEIVRKDVVPIASMMGDIGTAWMTHLEPMWREQPRAVAGITFGGALFCLEQLGRAYGLACTFSAAPSAPGALGPAVLTALRAGNRASPARALAATDGPVVWLMQQGPKIRPWHARISDEITL